MSPTRPHGPMTRAPWGLLPKFHRDPLGLLEDVGRGYPSLASLPFGPWTLYLATDEGAIQEVLRPHKGNFRKGPGMEANNPLIGQGLLLSEGNLWRDQRKAVARAFHPAEMDAYRVLMAERIDVGLAKFFRGESMDAKVFGRYLALAVTMQAFFGVEPKDESLDRLDEATAQVMGHFHHRARSVFRPPYHWPKAFNPSFHQGSAVLNAFIDPLFDDPATPLLLVLASAPVDRRNQEALTFLIAGHETTGSALAWTLRLLAEHPQVAERVADEAVADPKVGPGPYAEAVCLEALRLYPPVWLISRTAVQEVEVQGYRMAPGSDFLVSPWVTHRNQDYYLDPQVFRPERWLDQGQILRSRTDYRFLAFGGGPRRCPGEAFAMMELTLAISRICLRWKMRPRDETFPQPYPGVTLAPQGAMSLILTAR